MPTDFITLQFLSRFPKLWQLFRKSELKNGRSGWEKFRVPSVWLQSFKLLLDIVVSRTFWIDSDFLIWFFAISFLFVCLFGDSNWQPWSPGISRVMFFHFLPIRRWIGSSSFTVLFRTFFFLNIFVVQFHIKVCFNFVSEAWLFLWKTFLQIVAQTS